MENAAKENKTMQKSTRSSVLIFIIVTLLLTLGCCIFSVLCLYNTNIAFIKNRKLLFSILSCLLFLSIFGTCVWLILSHKDTIFKACFSGLILVIFSLVILFILLKTGFFNVISSESSFEEYLSKQGIWMPFVYIILQYLQVVVLPIPSTVSTLAGVALFGPFYTLIYSLIGIILGSLTAFFIGRKLGHKAVEWMVGKETLEKWQNKLKGKDNLLLTMMFVLPVFPDDVLCFVAGLSSMSNRYFVIMLIISRILAISVTCYSVELIPYNTWWGVSIWAAFFALVLLGFILVYKNLDKIHAWILKKREQFRARKK